MHSEKTCIIWLLLPGTGQSSLRCSRSDGMQGKKSLQKCGVVPSAIYVPTQVCLNTSLGKEMMGTGVKQWASPSGNHSTHLSPTLPASYLNLSQFLGGSYTKPLPHHRLRPRARCHQPVRNQNHSRPPNSGPQHSCPHHSRPRHSCPHHSGQRGASGLAG